MTDQELKDLVAGLATAQAKTDRQISEMNANTDKYQVEIQMKFDKRQAEIQAEFDKRQAEIRVEFDKRQAESDKRQSESDKRQAEIQAESDKRQAKIRVESDKRQAEIQAESDKRQAEFDKRQAEFDKRQAEIRVENKKYQDEARVKNEKHQKKINKLEAEATQSRKITELSLAQLTRNINKLGALYGGFSALLGDEAEVDFIQVLQEKPVLQDIEFDYVKPHLTRKTKVRDGHDTEVEIDIFLLNGDSMAVIEVKRHLQSKDIEKLHNETIPRFLALYPEYKDKKLYAALATYSVPKKAKPFVHKLLNEYGYALITPDKSGMDIIIDAHCMRVLNEGF